MQKHRLILIVFAAFITSVPGVAQSQNKCEPQQRKELVVTAFDKNGKAIDSLRAEQLTLKIGKSLATISDVTFQNNTQPIDIVIMIDTSVSQEKVLPLAKAGAQSFISSVATAGRDRVAIVPFSSKAINQLVLSSDFAKAAVEIDQIQIDMPVGYVGGGVVVGTSPPRRQLLPGSTSLWDVIGKTTQALFGTGDETRRRVMLLFSDGNDTSSSGKMNSVVEDAIKRGMSVFSIGVADPTYGPSESTLKKLAEQTGGIASFPKKKEDVDSALTEIAKRLRAGYVIGYCGESTPQGKFQIEVVDPEVKKLKPVLTYKRF